MSTMTQRKTWRLLPAGGAALEPTVVTRRASAFIAASANADHVTLLTMRDENGLKNYVIMPNIASANDAINHLAQALLATAEVEASPLSINTEAAGILIARSGGTPSRDTQVGDVPDEVAKSLLIAMRPGTWVAATYRQPARSERRRIRKWYASRLATSGVPVHHTSDDQAVVCSFTAGGADSDGVSALLYQLAAVLPGFDVEVKVGNTHTTRSVLPWAAGGLAVWGVAAAFASSPALPTVLSAPPAVAGLGIATGVLPSRASQIRKQIATGEFVAAPKRTIPPRKPKSGGVSNMNGQLQSLKPHEGDYPLASTAFMVGPGVIVGVVSPHSGSSAGAVVTEKRSAPPAVLNQIGPLIGTAGSAHAPVYISAADFWSGVGLIGQAGSGKSVALRGLYAWECLERVKPSGRPGAPGRPNTLVAFETKPDGATAYLDWVKATGDTAWIVELGDSSVPAIDIFDVPGTVRQKATFIANAMIYAFGKDSIQDRSFETIQNLLAAALVVDPQIAQEAGVRPNMSPFYYMSILLAAQGDVKAVELAGAIMTAAVDEERKRNHHVLESPDPQHFDEPETDLGLAESSLATYFTGKMTESQRRQFFDAPRNKVAQLLELEMWWSPSRPKMNWRTILNNHLNIVVNTGSSRSGVKIEERLTKQMSALLLYSLRDAIERNCAGWQAQSRSVSIFADELAIMAGSSPDVIIWLRNTGRSYGVCPIFATQYPEQLQDQVRKAFLGFGTIFWLSQSSPEIAATAAADLSLDGSDWQPQDVANLEPYMAIVRATVGHQRQPAFPTHLTFWEKDFSTFYIMQGYV